jgi:hypothetical protein
MRLGQPFARGALFAALMATTLCFIVTAYALRTTPAQGGGQVQATTSAGDGLRTVTFDTPSGKIYVRLPDDMRAGDTVSGTLVSEPRGGTEAERAGNLDALRGYQVDVGGQKVTAPEGSFKWVVPSHSIKPIIIIDVGSGKELANAPVPAQPAAPAGTSGTYQFPVLGQQGRPNEIHGPFDGDSSNTTLRFVPPGRTETGLNGSGPVRPLAESPRKIVFQSPVDLNGLAEIVLSERGTEARAPYRNVSVRLSAPKTNLTRGERTTLTVEVGGLDGIKEDVPLQLDARGVITMDGGSFQNLRIRPQEIRPDGRYTTTRDITGRQAGGFNVTATVIVRPFDMCLQDDRDPRLGFMWNSFTGNYVFLAPPPAGQPPSGGKLQPGGGAASGGAAQTGAAGGTGAPPPGGLSLTGVGKPTMKGCIITLSHDAPDRRVFARLDVCSNSGNADVQTSSPKSNFNTTDSNTRDSACTGSGPAAPVKSKDELLAELKELRENKKYDCEHGHEHQQALADRIAVVKRVLREFHGQTVSNDPIDDDCPPKK